MGLFVSDTDASDILEATLDKLQTDIGETLYPGDERRIFGESLAALLVITFNTMEETAKNSLLKYAIGDALDAIGDSYDCERLEASKASTTLRFSLSEAYTSDITIPSGTRASTETGLYFETYSEATITAGDTYVDVAAIATEGGTSYNGLLIGSVTTMVDLIAYVDSVTNIEATYGGTDEEEDDDYRERIRLKLSGFSTAGSRNAYRYWALSADNNVADAYIEAPSANVINVYIVTKTGDIPSTALLNTVQDVINSDDVRALDDLVTTLAPDAESYDIELTYYVSSENESATVEAIEEDGAIDDFILWQDTQIARDINPDYLKKLLFEAGADRVEITSPIYTELTGHTIAHFSGNLSVTHVVYDDN